MQLYLTARHMELTDALRAHVERHLREPVENHSDGRATRMEVQLYRDSRRDSGHRCHVLLNLTRRHDINIREDGGDLYAAIDLAKKRLVRALVNYREKKLTGVRHGRSATRAKIEL
jgi:ribosomal subunit interface protein